MNHVLSEPSLVFRFDSAGWIAAGDSFVEQGLSEAFPVSVHQIDPRNHGAAFKNQSVAALDIAAVAHGIPAPAPVGLFAAGS